MLYKTGYVKIHAWCSTDNLGLAQFLSIVAVGLTHLPLIDGSCRYISCADHPGLTLFQDGFI